jgi:hypothetical protein
MTARPAAALFLVAALLSAAARPSSATAQTVPSDSARAAADSLEARLRRAEEAIALLQQQLGEQASSGTTTRSRMQLEFNGRVVVNAFRNNRRVNNVDDPQFVRPDSASALPVTAFGMAIRQTTLGLVVTARDVLGGRFVGDVDVDFYGGQQASSGGRTFPLLRLRTARGAVKWSNGELLIGQEAPLVAGLNPVTPAAVGTPEFVTAGNLWLWLPQVRGTIELDGPVRVALQAAVLAPTTGDAVGLFDTDADNAERSDRPATEARVRARWGEEDHPSEVGCGGHLAWVAVPGVRARTSAFACDARVALGRLELRGEGYTGRGLRGLGGGGISQNLANTGFPLHDSGGWAQLNLDVTSMVRAGGGCGIDKPDEGEVAAGGRLRNQACSGYTIVRPAGPLFFGAEYRRLQTKYASGSVGDGHVNLSVGFEF